MTEQDQRNVQKLLNLLGADPRLDEDGDFQTLSREALERELAKRTPTPITPPPMDHGTVVLGRETTLRNALVAKMHSQLGQRETGGKNRSPLIDKVNAYTRAGMGAPYCIGACVYDVNEVCHELGLRNPVPAECSTQAFYSSAPSTYRRPNGIHAKKGDIGILQNRGDVYHGHAYMFREDQASKTHLTIEANTDGSGGRDGDGWYERTRSDDGDGSKRYLGAVDVAQWILDHNPDWKG